MREDELALTPLEASVSKHDTRIELNVEAIIDGKRLTLRFLAIHESLDLGQRHAFARNIARRINRNCEPLPREGA